MNLPQLIFFGLLIVAGTGNGFVISQNGTDEKSKIEGGDYIRIDKAPYHVYLKEGDHFYCGGALITPNVVLTSAHCLENVKNDILPSIIAGTDHIEGTEAMPGIEIFPETVITHPKYTSINSFELQMKYDIAILVLQESFPITNKISPIDLPTGSVTRGEELLFTGVGATDGFSFRSSPYLKAYQPKAVSCKSYLSSFEPPFTNFDGIICHKNYKGHRSRLGDSGGPLVNSRGQLAGIHQGSTLRCQVAVNVFYMLDWIRENIRLYANEVL